MAGALLNKLEIDAFSSLRSFSEPQVSPDGQHLCFVTHQPDLAQNKNISALWHYTVAEGAHRLTTSGSDLHPRWMNNQTLLFISKRDAIPSRFPKTIFYALDVHGGEAEKAFEVPYDVSRFEILQNGNFVFQFMYHPEFNGLTDEKKRLEIEEESDAIQVIDEIPFWSNGEGFTNKVRSALGLYNRDQDSFEMLTDQLSTVEDWALNSTKTQIAFIQNKFRDKQVAFNSLSLYSLEQRQIKDLSHKDDFAYGQCAWKPDDTLLFYGTDFETYGLNQNGTFFELNIETGHVTPVSLHFDGTLGSSVGTDIKLGSGTSPRPLWYKDRWIFVSTVNADAPLLALTQNGGTSLLTPFDLSVSCYEYAVLNGSLVVFALVGQNPQELYEIFEGTEIESPALRCLTALNEEAMKSVFVSEPEALEFYAPDGTALTGWILKPYQFDSERRYTGILNIHGGPKTVFGSQFNHEMQYWASEGFVVFYMNPRGSDGRGNQFSDMRGNYGTIDYDDLMLFTDKVLEHCPWIDSNRLGVTGGSYGGFMTNWIIGHTHRFKAAVSQRSISNWISKFGTTDIGYFFVPDQLGADPWTDFDLLWDRSPLKYASHVMTPTLFIHSDEDYRCWSAEAYQMFTALRYHGIKSRLCLFHGENHELSRSGKPNNRVRRLHEITKWMKAHL